MMGPGTLPSRGRDRLDLVRYRKSGLAQMSGAELLEALPESAAIAPTASPPWKTCARCPRA
jgi:hypothetical protein